MVTSSAAGQIHGTLMSVEGHEVLPGYQLLGLTGYARPLPFPDQSPVVIE